MKLNVYLVNKPEDVITAWSLIREGLIEVQRKGHGEETLDYVLQQIINHQLFLWVIFDEEKYIGFITTKKVFNFYQGENVGCLIINHYYKNIKSWNKETNRWMNDFLDSHAKETGCKFIKMYTARDKERYWNDLGYKKAYVEYIKELED